MAGYRTCLARHVLAASAWHTVPVHRTPTPTLQACYKDEAVEPYLVLIVGNFLGGVFWWCRTERLSGTWRGGSRGMGLTAGTGKQSALSLGKILKLVGVMLGPPALVRSDHLQLYSRSKTPSTAPLSPHLIVLLPTDSSAIPFLDRYRMESILLSLFTLVRTLPAKYLGRSRPLGETYLDAVVPETKRFLAAGKSGVVYEIDPERVLKEYHDADACETEHIVYKRLDSHPNIAKVLEIRTDGSLVLERGTPLRSIIRAPSNNEISIETKVRWLRHAAEGYRYLHTHGIIHGDVGSHNLVLTGQDCIKLIDFEGCSIDGGPAGSCYEWFSYRPSMPRVSRGTDIFAFGCVIYEVSTGRPPFHELEASDDRYERVEQLYTTQQFPDITNLPLGSMMRQCWEGKASSMSEIITELEAFPT